MRLWFALWVLAGTVSHLKAAAPSKLVVIEIDGLDYRFLKDANRLHLKIPVLLKMLAQGTSAAGVVAGPPRDAQPPLTAALWEAAMKAKLKTALLFWPATAASSADFVCPFVPPGPGSAEVAFESVAQQCTTGLADRVGSVYPRFSKSLWNDESAMMALDYLLQYEKPDLSLVHLADLNAEERESGALSLYSRELLENDDDLLAQMLPLLPAQTAVAIVSDHGLDTEEHVVRPRVLAGSSAIEVKYGLIGASDQRAAAVLRKLIGVKKDGIAREVPLAEVRHYAPELHNWVAAFGTMPGYVALEDANGPPVGPGNRKGVYGLWPTRPNYRSVFLLWGPGVRAASLGEISSAEISPTLAAIVGISPLKPKK